MSKVEGFAAVPNWMIRDRSIPRNAVLVYASLSSRAGMGAIFPSQATIAEEAGVSERTVRNMIVELEERGLIVRHRRTTKGKKRVTDGYTLHPNGVPANSAGSSDLPESKDVSTGNEQQCVPLIEVDKEEVDKDLASVVPFDDFWAVWPRKESKKNALAAWAKAVKKIDAQSIVDAATAYASSPFVPEVRFVPYAATWLNGERWNDPLPSAPANGKQSAVEAGRGALALLAQRRELEAVTS